MFSREHLRARLRPRRCSRLNGFAMDDLPREELLSVIDRAVEDLLARPV